MTHREPGTLVWSWLGRDGGLLATGSVAQVDVAAAPDTAAPVAPIYPDSLLRAGVDGRVLAEFVVDSAGEPEMETFGEVVSTHVRFTDAVRRAVAQASFTPAVVGGRKVRQLVQMPFRFVAPASAGADQ